MTQLAFSEKQVHCELTWQSFDCLTWLVGCGSEADLGQVVADPAEFAKHRKGAALVFSDAVPVWLHGHEGRPLVPVSVLESIQKERRQERLADALQRAGKEEEAQLARAAMARPLGQLDGPGKPAQEKLRLTWLARQCIDHYFNIEQVPKGRAHDSILMVRSASHCPLENISLTGEWVESEEFEAEG